nr:LOW QUALITY PROTEIN: uncharacterized protein LOC124492594 [Dermatophagoides farinae]
MFRTKLLFIVLNLLAIGHYSEQLDCMNNGNNDNEDECMKRYKISSHIQTNDQSNQNNNHNMIRMRIRKKLKNYGQSLNYIDVNYSDLNVMSIEIFRHKDGKSSYEYQQSIII